MGHLRLILTLRAKIKKDFLPKKKSFTHMGHLGLEPRTKGL